MATNTKNIALAPYISNEIKKAMIDIDVKTEQLGSDATGRAWRYRLAHPGRMTMEDFLYLCDRLYVDPGEVMTNAQQARDRATRRRR